jgi:hypothetical protein
MVSVRYLVTVKIKPTTVLPLKACTQDIVTLAYVPRSQLSMTNPDTKGLAV